MTALRALTLCTLLLSASLGFAQETGNGPGMAGPATGTRGVPGVPGMPSASSTLDLPMAPPSVPQVPVPRAPEEPEDEDDPRDTPPPTIYGEEIDSENDTIVYVLDISYSMNLGKQSYVRADQSLAMGSRMDRAKAELVRSIDGLGDNFSFNVIAYDCATEAWQEQLVEATSGNKNAAKAWVMGRTPRGATGTGPACALALAAKGNQAVVLLTDGAPNCGASGTDGHRTMIATANTQGATINVFGIAATGRYRAFCQGVAADSGGSYFDVP